MKNYHANGWQDFSEKKDIEKIVRNTSQAKIINTGIMLDLFLLLLGIIIEQSVPVGEWAKKIYLFILIAIAAFSLCAVWVKQLCRYVSEHIKGKDIRTKKFIDIFDNEICYYVMMSKSFQDLLINCNGPEDLNKKVFYYTEMSFYRNKAIRKLYRMIQVLQMVFETDIGKIRVYRRVSVFRLENILRLIEEINECISVQETSIQTYHSKDILIQENKERLNNFNQFKKECKNVFNIL